MQSETVIGVLSSDQLLQPFPVYDLIVHYVVYPSLRLKGAFLNLLWSIVHEVILALKTDGSHYYFPLLSVQPISCYVTGEQEVGADQDNRVYSQLLLETIGEAI